MKDVFWWRLRENLMKQEWVSPKLQGSIDVRGFFLAVFHLLLFFELDTFFMGSSTFSACSYKGIALVTRCLQPWTELFYSTNLNTMKYRVQSRKKQSLCQTRSYLSQIPWFILIGKVGRLQRHASGNLRERKISIPSYPLISGQPTFTLVSYSIY